MIFVIAPSDQYAACDAAAVSAGAVEVGTSGISIFPPGYECLYVGTEDEVVALDAGGWAVVASWVAVGLLLLGGFVSVVRRLVARRR